MSAEMKEHRALFGWQDAGTELERLTPPDIFRYGKEKYRRWVGAEPKAGDWALEINHYEASSRCEYDCEQADYGDALRDVGLTLAKTGAAIVAVEATYVDEQGGAVRFLLRGGNWEGVHAGMQECIGCDKKMQKPESGCGFCPPCDEKNKAGWAEWCEKHPAEKCEKCGLLATHDSDRSSFPLNPTDEPGGVYWDSCMRKGCPNFKGKKCADCGCPTYTDGDCTDRECPSRKRKWERAE